MRVIKYSSRLSWALDVLSYTLTYPFLTCLSQLVCSYLVTTWERRSTMALVKKVFVDFLLLGPLFLGLTVALFPTYLGGQALWIALCYIANENKDFALIKLDKEDATTTEQLCEKRVFTFASANLLLGFNVLGKFQNMPNVVNRAKNILNSFTRMTDEPIFNLKETNTKVSKSDSVMSEWPDVDFFLFQEVWDRIFVGLVVRALKHKFKHYVVDVSRHSLSNNLCSGSSGLMLASRYPVMTAEFQPFVNKKCNWQAFISYGMIMAKVDLDMEQPIADGAKRRVGFIANLHCMAYQEKEDLIGDSLILCQKSYRAFRQNNTSEGEKVVFAVIGGDFNFDNMSPGDSKNWSHSIFDDYEDICVSKPGSDKPWVIGTELRQLRIYDKELATPECFREALVDDVTRRKFVIDADVKEHTMDLMYCEPKPNSSGQVDATRDGGMRRIDRILLDPNCAESVTGAAFVSATSGQTDHIPFAVSVAEKI